MASRTLLIVAFVVILILIMSCGTPAPAPTAVPQPTRTSPPRTDSTPTAVLQPTDTSPPPSATPSLPPATVAPTDTPQPPTATATPVPAAKSAPEGARVTFLSNAGFLITAGDRKILIDALYSGEPAGVLNSVVAARPPFDAIDLILVTHEHSDHFSPDLMARAMGQNPEAVFVSTQRVVERLLGADGSLRDRAIPIQLQAGESEQLDVNGIGLEALYISHGVPNLLNLGFVITVGDIQFLHTGDSTPDDITVSYLQSYGLPEMQLDVAFVPYFYLTQRKYQAYALEGIQARYFIPMHYEARNPPLGIEDDFPNAVVFRYALASWELPLAAEATPATTAEPSPSSDVGGLIAFYSERGGNAEIYTMNADGSDQRNLTNHPASDTDPSWSPDGSRIAFSSNRDGDYEIYVMDADGGNVRRLTDNPAVDAGPVWSPDGSQIAFLSLRTGNCQIFSINADGSDLQRLARNSYNDWEIDWSPDGTQIAVSSQVGEYADIYTFQVEAALQGIAERQQLTDTNAHDAFPRWSPDGSQIAFISNRAGGDNWDVYAMNSDGSNQMRLTGSAGVDGLPTWSPDGTQIAFESNRDGDNEIYVMDADDAEQGSENVRRLTDNNAADRKPAWRPSMTTPSNVGISCACTSLDPLQTQLVYDVETFNETEFWSFSTPEEEGMDSALLETGVAALAESSNLYSVLVVRNDKIVLERYFRGEVPRHAHDIASASKSFLSALVGIAIHEGYIQSVDQTAAEFLPTYFASTQDPRKLDITLRHLLTMTPGFSYPDTLYDLEGDWLATAISYPLVSEPGSRFSYSTMSSHILSAILTKATEMSTCEFACRYLFEPIGVTIDNWSRDPQGYYMGGVAMYFTPRELAKFGLLYLHNGVWDGHQVVPAEWIAESMTPRSTDTGFPGVSYGFSWWLEIAQGHKVYAAVGHGGQTIRILPDLNLVVITTADLYAPSQNIEVFPLIEEYVIPSIQDAAPQQTLPH